MVTSLVINFEQSMHINNAAAVTLKRRDGATNVGISLLMSADGKSCVVSFAAGTDVVAGSLVDGIYDLVVGVAAFQDAGSQSPASAFTYTFHRLFGDADGDHDVDAIDVTAIRPSLNKLAGQPGYLSYFDELGDGDVDAADLTSMRNRLGRRYNY